jgi:clan AA aspartic protease (TIGR02281 family)
MLKSVSYRDEAIDATRKKIEELVVFYSERLKKQKNSQELINFLQFLVNRDPSHTPYYLLLAEAQIETRQYEAALATLDVIANDPYQGHRAAELLASLEQRLALTTRGGISIPLKTRGQHFIVEAIVNERDTLRLMIDTGASISAITPEAASLLNVDTNNPVMMQNINTANGTVRSPIVQVDSFAIEDARVRDFQFAVLPLNSMRDIDGLLGMNYLQRYRFFIDQSRALLILEVD